MSGQRLTGTLRLPGANRPARPPQDFIDHRRATRMARVDAMPLDWRTLVHEYGLSIVEALQAAGISKPRSARHLVETVLNELSPIRGSYSAQGSHRAAGRYVLVSVEEPTAAMIEASMETVSGHDLEVSKREKHRLRLKAALAAAAGRR